MWVFAFFKVVILLLVDFLQCFVLIVDADTFPEYSLFFQLVAVLTEVMDHNLKYFRNSPVAFIILVDLQFR